MPWPGAAGSLTEREDRPFWVAVLEERFPDGTVRAVGHVFGAEPTNPELYEFLLRHGTALLRRVDRAAAAGDAPRVDLGGRRPRIAGRSGN
ncbi:DUF2992 family protein [Dactylosporangium sp. CA-139066]|uniref:DUF2992 family protein n=1 Tax=Dactylosporangium sp. CA-139066 TaxID=3239930 RepID=UPI003D8E901C